MEGVGPVRWSCSFLLLLAAPALPQEGRFRKHELKVPQQEFRGAALDGARLFAWGTALVEWKLPDGRPRLLARGDFQEGGCLTDLDGDGSVELVAQEGAGLGDLVWRRPPAFRPALIDSGIEMHDCLPATLFGRGGVLMVHRYGQVRFYERPPKSGGRWPYREIYSFYTASRQGGLLLNDVDRDGFTDIVSGNYWIRSPQRFELPWRLFAINTDYETPDSATARFALLDPSRLVVSQGHKSSAKLSIFTRPRDPTQLWNELRLNPSRTLTKPHGLDAADFDGDGDRDIVVAENGGEGSRTFLIWNQDAIRFRAEKIAEGAPVYFLKATDLNRDGKPDLLTAGERSVTWWENVYPFRK